MNIKIMSFKESGKFNVVNKMTSNREVHDTAGILESIYANFPHLKDGNFVFSATNDSKTELNCRLIKGRP